MIKINYLKFLPVLGLLFIPLFFNVQLAHAASGAGVPDSIPQWVKDDINTHCNSPYNSPLHWGLVSDTWLSPVGQPSQTNINIAQGTSSINLDLNAIYYRCHVNGGAYPVNGTSDVTFISQADRTNIPVPVSFTGTYPSTGLGGNRYNQIVVRQVTYTPSAPFQNSQQVTVNLFNRGYYSATNDIDRCSIWNTGDYNGLPHQDNTNPNAGATDCVTGISPFTINVTITQVTIQGAVYSPSGIALDNVPISGTNVPGGVTTGSPHPGWFSFNETIGNWFSIHAQDPFIGTNGHNYSAVKITPYIGSVDRSAGATSCSFNGTNYSGPASYSGYEWQNANSPNSGTAQCNYGLSTNGGYDFHYTKEQYAHLTASTSVTPTAALYTTQQATFTTTIASTNTLPDDGNDTYTYTVSSYNLVGTNHNSFPTSDSGTCSATASPKLYPDNSHTVTCTITVPSSVPSGSKLCMEVALTSNASYATKSITGSPACVSVITPPTFAINAPTDYELYSDVTSPTTNPSSKVTSIKVGYTVTCNGYRGTLNLTVAADPKFASHTTTATCSGGTNPTGSWEIFPSPAGTIDTYGVGDYTFTGTIAGGTPSGVSALPPSLLPIQATPATFTIYTVPYARFYGNDIYSGGTVTFNTKDSTSTGAYGSASQYAVLAHGLISMASNALSSTTTSPTGPGNLSAANFGATQPLVGLPSTGTTPIDWNASGYYGDTSSDQTLSGTTGVTQKVTIIGKDIFINGNITVTPPTGTFNDSTTPVVLIVAQGDVYISSTVTQLDAIIEATGNIYTCSPNTAAKTHDESCTSPLLVNGVLGAGSQIHFDRSFGTRLTAGDASTNAGSYMHYSDLTQPGYNGAAEVINFPAYLYFASSYISSATSQGTKPDSLVNVAPLL